MPCRTHHSLFVSACPRPASGLPPAKRMQASTVTCLVLVLRGMILTIGDELPYLIVLHTIRKKKNSTKKKKKLCPFASQACLVKTNSTARRCGASSLFPPPRPPSLQATGPEPNAGDETEHSFGEVLGNRSNDQERHRSEEITFSM